MTINKSPPVRLADYERNILKSLIDMNIKSSVSIARSVNINQGAMVDAIGGNRSINYDSLHSLMNKIGLDDHWELRRDIPHFYNLSADLSLILPIVERLKDPLLWWIPPVFSPSVVDMNCQALKTYFVIRSADGHLIIIDRDPWRIGKGKKALVAAKDALPFTPEHIQNLQWSGNDVRAAKLNLLPNKILPIMDIFRKDDSNPDKNELLHLLFNEESPSSDVSWDAVITYATSNNLSPAVIMKWMHSIR